MSVIILAHNAKAFLATTLESAFARTYRDLDVVVMDDGSAGRTGAIAASFPQATYIYQANPGPAAARNAGLRRAKRENVALVRGTCSLLLLICLALGGTLLPAPLEAQSAPNWSDVMQLSDEATFAQGPALALDRTGGLHAFWSSRPVEGRAARLAIAHSTIVSGKWLSPQEIVLSPNNRGAGIPRVAVDQDNNLHLFWATSGWVGDLYHSWAPANQSHFATAWSAAELIEANVYQHDVVAGPNGDLPLVYASQSQGICHIVASAETDMWTDPTCFRSPALRDQEYDTRPSLALDGRDFLHVVWVVSDYSPDRLLAYPGRAIYHARSVDSGFSWSDPLLIDEVESRVAVARSQPEWPTIAVDAQDRVHIVWVGQGMLRYHEFSTDHGDTWTEPRVAIRAGGYNNWMGLATGDSGIVHFVTASLNGLLYSYWDGTRWSDPREFPNTRGAHYADALTAPDGSLHAVWQDHGGGNAEEGHILYAYRDDHGAGLSGHSIVLVTPSPPVAQETAQPPPSPAATSPVEPPAGGLPSSVEGIAPTSGVGQSVMSSLALPIVSTVLFLLFVLSFSRWRKRNR